MVDLAATIFRDFETDGVPSSGVHKPRKAKIREWGAYLEGFISAFIAGGGLIFDTRANLFASLAYPANSQAWVISDATVAYNGIYRKFGASGTGSWTRVADLPYSFIRLNDGGAGTANAIIATSSIPLPGTASAALLVMNVFEANSGPVTIAANGAVAKPLKTSSGNDLAAGYLTAGMMVAFLDDGTNFRLMSDVASAAIQAAAVAAAAAAALSEENAGTSATNAAAWAAGVNLPSIQPGDAGKTLIVKVTEDGYLLGDPSGGTPGVPTRAELKALDTTKVMLIYLTEAGREGTFIWRGGNLSSLVALDMREGIYVAPASDPTGASGAWVRQNERRFLAEWFGAVGDGVTNDGPAINAALTVVGISGEIDLVDKIYATSETISVHRDGQRLRGRMAGHTFSVAPSASEGTVLKWIGAAGGTLAYFGCQPGGTADMSGGGIENVQFNGNLLADKCLHIRSCSFSTFRGLRPFNARDNASAVCLLLDSDTATRPGINSIYRCNFYNTAIATGGAAATGLLVTGAIDEIGGQHTAFVSFHGLHVTHDDGDAIKITAADDMLFADIGVSKVAGGTGISVHVKPNANRGVVGLTFIQIHLGSNDVPEFRADASNPGAICHGIFIYGLSGVDQAATVTEMGGATIEVVDYTGTVYNPDPAVRGAYRKTPPMKVGNYASADDATLDYYKERLGNVVLTFGGAAVGMTMSNSFYRSTRIGNLVHFKAQIILTAKGSSTGAAVISGLPYSAVDGWALAIRATAMTSGVGDTHLSAITNNTSVGLSKMAAGIETSLTHADFTNTSSIVVSGVYQTADAAA